MYLCNVTPRGLINLQGRTVSHSFMEAAGFSEMLILLYTKGRAVAKWLWHYATNRQVAGSMPDGVIGIFQ